MVWCDDAFFWTVECCYDVIILIIPVTLMVDIRLLLSILTAMPVLQLLQMQFGFLHWLLWNLAHSKGYQPLCRVKFCIDQAIFGDFWPPKHPIMVNFMNLFAHRGRILWSFFLKFTGFMRLYNLWKCLKSGVIWCINKVFMSIKLQQSNFPPKSVTVFTDALHRVHFLALWSGLLLLSECRFSEV